MDGRRGFWWVGWFHSYSTFIISHFPGRSSLWSAEESVLLIPSLTREMLNMVVACTVSNSEGSGTDTIKIDVACEY